MKSTQKKNQTGSMNPYWQQGMQDRAVEFTQPTEGGQPFDLFNQVSQVDEMEIFSGQTSSHSAANLQMGGAPAEATGISELPEAQGLSTMDKAHLALASVGIGTTFSKNPYALGAGLASDLVDAGLYAVERDLLGTGLSIMSALPVLGDKYNVAKLAHHQKKVKAAYEATNQKHWLTQKKLVDDAMSAMTNPKYVKALTKFAEYVPALGDDIRYYNSLVKAGDMEMANKVMKIMEWKNPGFKSTLAEMTKGQLDIVKKVNAVPEVSRLGLGEIQPKGRTIPGVDPVMQDKFYAGLSKIQSNYEWVDGMRSAFSGAQRTGLSQRYGGQQWMDNMGNVNLDALKHISDVSSRSRINDPSYLFSNALRLIRSEESIKNLEGSVKKPNIENMGY